jgi:hypothetical protein
MERTRVVVNVDGFWFNWTASTWARIDEAWTELHPDVVREGRPPDDPVWADVVELASSAWNYDRLSRQPMVIRIPPRFARRSDEPPYWGILDGSWGERVELHADRLRADEHDAALREISAIAADDGPDALARIGRVAAAALVAAAELVASAKSYAADSADTAESGESDGSDGSDA